MPMIELKANWTPVNWTSVMLVIMIMMKTMISPDTTIAKHLFELPATKCRALSCLGCLCLIIIIIIYSDYHDNHFEFSQELFT